METETARRVLATLIAEQAGGRGTVALAVAGHELPEPAAVWRPQTVAEPLFLVYSVTKMVIASLTLQLWGEGRLVLDEPVGRWFPDLPRGEAITIRQLLNHTAGLPDYGGLPEYAAAVRAAPGRPWTDEAFAAHTYAKGLLFEPGAGWAYANPGYLLLRRLLSAVTADSLAGLVSQRIAAPLGLTRTFVPRTADDLRPLAPALSRLISEDGEPLDVRGRYHPGWVSHGVVAAPASEIAQLAQALFAGRLVSAEALAEMMALVPVPAAPRPWVRPGYGLGLMGDPASPHGRLYGHGGGGPGYNAAVFHAPDHPAGPLTVCALCAEEGTSLAQDLVFAAFGRL